MANLVPLFLEDLVLLNQMGFDKPFKARKPEVIVLSQSPTDIRRLRDEFLKNPDITSSDIRTAVYLSPKDPRAYLLNQLTVFHTVRKEFPYDPEISNLAIKRLFYEYSAERIPEKISEFKTTIAACREQFKDDPDLDENTLLLIAACYPHNIHQSITIWLDRYTSVKTAFEGEIDEWILKEMIAYYLYSRSDLMTKIKKTNSFIKNLEIRLDAPQTEAHSLYEKLPDQTSPNPEESFLQQETRDEQRQTILETFQHITPDEQEAITAVFEFDWFMQHEIRTVEELKKVFQTDDLQRYVDETIIPKMRGIT